MYGLHRLFRAPTAQQRPSKVRGRAAGRPAGLWRCPKLWKRAHRRPRPAPRAAVETGPLLLTGRRRYAGPSPPSGRSRGVVRRASPGTPAAAKCRTARAPGAMPEGGVFAADRPCHRSPDRAGASILHRRRQPSCMPRPSFTVRPAVPGRDRPAGSLPHPGRGGPGRADLPRPGPGAERTAGAPRTAWPAAAPPCRRPATPPPLSRMRRSTKAPAGSGPTC